MAESFSAPYIECSAKNNDGIVNVFELILIQLFKIEKKERDKRMAEMRKLRNIKGKHDSSRPQDSCCSIF